MNVRVIVVVVTAIVGHAFVQTNFCKDSSVFFQLIIF